MAILPKRTINSRNPVTRDEIKAFSDKAEIGDTLYARLSIRTFKNMAMIDFVEKSVKVTILNKYPHVVETDKGIFTWSELLIGYYSYSGPEYGKTDNLNSFNEISKSAKRAA